MCVSNSYNVLEIRNELEATIVSAGMNKNNTVRVGEPSGSNG